MKDYVKQKSVLERKEKAHQTRPLRNRLLSTYSSADKAINCPVADALLSSPWPPEIDLQQDASRYCAGVPSCHGYTQRPAPCGAKRCASIRPYSSVEAGGHRRAAQNGSHICLVFRHSDCSCCALGANP